MPRALILEVREIGKSIKESEKTQGNWHEKQEDYGIWKAK